jgi:hypothetical protein
LLDMPHRQGSDLGPSQPAAEQDCQHRAVAQPLLGGRVWCVEAPAPASATASCRVGLPSISRPSPAQCRRPVPAPASRCRQARRLVRTAVIRMLTETEPSAPASSEARAKLPRLLKSGRC